MMIIGINLLYLIHNEVGGTETYAIHLLKSLEKIIPADMTIILFINENTDENLFPNSFKKVKLPFKAQNRGVRYFFEQLILPFYVKYHNVSLLHSFGYVGPIVLSSKHVVTIFDANLFRIPMSNIKKMVYGFFLKKTAQTCDAIITSSNFSKQEIMNFLKQNSTKISVIYLGVQEDLRDQKWKGIPEGEKYIFALSNKSKHKNISQLIAAVSLLREDFPDLKLKVAGFIPSDENFDSSFVEILGYVSREKLISLYCGCYSFAMPSLYEGFGIPAVEAMVLGVPTFLSATTSLGEIGKGAAELFDPESVASIRETIKKVISDDSRIINLSKRCFRKGLTFNWDRTAEELVKIYQNFL